MHKFITPRVGSDVTLIILTLITTKFQSTLPVWGATVAVWRINYGQVEKLVWEHFHPVHAIHVI